MSPMQPSSLSLRPAASEASTIFAPLQTAVSRLPSSEWRSIPERWIRGSSPRNSRSSRDRSATFRRSEQANGARIQLRWITDVSKAKSFHVFPRDALHGLRCDTLQLVDEAFSFTVITFIELPSCQA